MLRGFALVSHAQRNEVGVDTIFSEHGTYGAHRHRHRQYRHLMGFNDDCVARSERSKQAGVGVPGGESTATHHHRHTTPDDFKMLLHCQRRVLALGFFPMGFTRHKTLLAPGMRHSLKTTVLRVRRTRLKRHHPALA